MPVRVLRSNRSAVRRPRRGRTTTWATTDLTVTVAAAGQNNIDLLADLEVAGSSVVGITVLRTLLWLHVQNWAAVGDYVRTGLIVEDKGYVGTTQALATNRNLDWMYLTPMAAVASGAAVSVASLYPATGWPADIRSRRVIKDMGRTSILALSNSSAASKTIDVFVRQLIGLP